MVEGQQHGGPAGQPSLPHAPAQPAHLLYRPLAAACHAAACPQPPHHHRRHPVPTSPPSLPPRTHTPAAPFRLGAWATARTPSSAPTSTSGVRWLTARRWMWPSWSRGWGASWRRRSARASAWDSCAASWSTCCSAGGGGAGAGRGRRRRGAGRAASTAGGAGGRRVWAHALAPWRRGLETATACAVGQASKPADQPIAQPLRCPIRRCRRLSRQPTPTPTCPLPTPTPPLHPHPPGTLRTCPPLFLCWRRSTATPAGGWRRRRWSLTTCTRRSSRWGGVLVCVCV